jgi:hypothetical protein
MSGVLRAGTAEALRELQAMPCPSGFGAEPPGDVLVCGIRQHVVLCLAGEVPDDAGFMTMAVSCLVGLGLAVGRPGGGCDRGGTVLAHGRVIPSGSTGRR